MAMLPWIADRRPRPDQSLIVRGIYRPLTLPEVAALLPDVIHQSEGCPYRCNKTWDGLRRHLACARRDVGPHLHYLHIWQLRQWLGQPIVISERMDVAPCSWMHEVESHIDKKNVMDTLRVVIPQRIVHRADFYERGLEIRVRTMHLYEPVSSDEWAEFLDPYCTPRGGEGPWYEGWLNVGDDGRVCTYGTLMVWAELVKETRLP